MLDSTIIINNSSSTQQDELQTAWWTQSRRSMQSWIVIGAKNEAGKIWARDNTRGATPSTLQLVAYTRCPCFPLGEIEFKKGGTVDAGHTRPSCMCPGHGGAVSGVGRPGKLVGLAGGHEDWERCLEARHL
jgi:hypothetical protein